jgi:hypothetical protein
MKKQRLSFNGLSQVMKQWCATINLQANITQDQEIQRCTFYWQSDIDAVLGL